MSLGGTRLNRQRATALRGPPQLEAKGPFQGSIAALNAGQLGRFVSFAPGGLTLPRGATPAIRTTPAANKAHTRRMVGAGAKN